MRGLEVGDGMRGAGCGMWDAGCGMRDAGCGMRDAEWLVEVEGRNDNTI